VDALIFSLVTEPLEKSPWAAVAPAENSNVQKRMDFILVPVVLKGGYDTRFGKGAPALAQESGGRADAFARRIDYAGLLVGLSIFMGAVDSISAFRRLKILDLYITLGETDLAQFVLQTPIQDPDDFSDHSVGPDETPIAAIEAVVAVVTHDKIVPRRDFA
jgi:hypothetical protein